MPNISSKIQITQEELTEAKKALGITVPIYTASKYRRVITITTRLGSHKYPLPRKSKKVTT